MVVFNSIRPAPAQVVVSRAEGSGAYNYSYSGHRTRAAKPETVGACSSRGQHCGQGTTEHASGAHNNGAPVKDNTGHEVEGNIHDSNSGSAEKHTANKLKGFHSVRQLTIYGAVQGAY